MDRVELHSLWKFLSCAHPLICELLTVAGDANYSFADLNHYMLMQRMLKRCHNPMLPEYNHGHTSALQMECVFGLSLLL